MRDYAVIRLEGVQVGIADVIGENASPDVHEIQTARVLLDGSRLPEVLGIESMTRLRARTWTLTVGEQEGMHLESWTCGAFKNGVHILDGAVFRSP